MHGKSARRRRAWADRPMLRARLLRLEPLEDRYLLSVDFNTGALLPPLVNRVDVGLGTLGGFSPIEPALSINDRDPGNVAVTSAYRAAIDEQCGRHVHGNHHIPQCPGQTGNSGDTDTTYDSQGRLFWSNLVAFLASGMWL